MTDSTKLVNAKVIWKSTQNLNGEFNERLLRLREVLETTGLCRTSLYNLQKEGSFPKSVTLNKRSARWSFREVQSWCAQQVAARNGQAGAL